MGDKLEVLPGPGLVARYGDIAAWAGPQASPALQAHLVGEAQRTSQVQNGGDQFASSLIAVLQRGDPEPQAAFAVVGPGANGLTLFLHGPVQAWDSGRWLAPQPVPGWMVTSIGRPWPLIILPYGATPPPQSQQGNPFDLVVGAVPGSGFVLLRPPAGPIQPTGVAPQAAGAPQPAGGTYGAATGIPAGTGPGAPAEVGAAGALAGGSLAAGPGAASPGAAGPEAGGAGPAGAGPAGAGSGPASGGAAGTSPGADGGAGAAVLGVAAAGAAAAGAAGTIAAGGGAAGGSPEGAGGAAPAAGASIDEAAAAAGAAGGPAVAPLPETGAALGQEQPGAGQFPAGGTVDLRSVFPPGRAPLPLASAWGMAVASDLPEVPGVRCELGHFNHPRASNCFRCGRPIVPGSPQQNAPRPPVGVLLADDGSIWSLSRGCLIGSDPGTAPEVQSGTAQGITLRAGPNHAMAPIHAEIQIRVWSTFLVDRGAEGGTWLQGPDAQGWAQLGRNEQRELANGSHLSCGGRVLTYLSAWPA